MLGLLGGGILAYGLSHARRARAARAWPEVPGRIVAVNVAKIWIGRGSIYYPEVRYSYTAQDTILEGSRIGFISALPRSSHGATVYALQHTYPRGQQVKVRYNPDNPRDAVLEPGIRSGLRTVLGAGVLLLALAAVVAIAGSWLEAGS